MNYLNSHQRQQAKIVNTLRMILKVIQLKPIHPIISEVKKIFIFLHTAHQSSYQIQQQLSAIRDALKLLLQSSRKYGNSLLAEMYFCLALASQITNHEETQSNYKIAVLYSQSKPIINLSYSLFLYGKQKYVEGLKHLNKLKVETAFYDMEDRINIWNILYCTVDTKIYQKLSRPINRDAIDEISQRQFILNIIKFKQYFFYRCTQIQELSENSYSSLAWILYNFNMFEDALILTQKLKMINHPVTQNTQINLTGLFYKFGKWEDCVEHAEQVLRINPRNQSAYLWLIAALMQMNRKSQGIDCALRLMNINRYNYYAYQLLGRILCTQGHKYMGEQYFRLAVVISPSQQTYGILANGLFRNGKLCQAEKYYLKSIRIKPKSYIYSFLGQLYLSSHAYLNAIHCFIQAIQQNYTDQRYFFYLGYCSQKNQPFQLIINNFFNKMKKENSQNQILQTNLAVYNFISKQSKSQFFDFISKFLQQRKKGEQTVYSDIATNLIKGYNISEYKYLDPIFAILMGYLGRVKEKYSQTHQIYLHLIHKYKTNKKFTVCDAFTQIYYQEISKTPKQLQSILLQFLLAQMVMQNTQQAIRCYYKSLSYAQGDYEQFHLQLYKIMHGHIEQVYLIEYIASTVFSKPYLSNQDYQIINNTIRRNIFEGLNIYICSLELLAQLIRRLRQLEEQGWPQKQAHGLLLYMKSEIFLNLNLDWRVFQSNQTYNSIYEQINEDENMFKRKVNRLFEIYCKKAQLKQFLKSATLLIQIFYDDFALNQKIKLIFNHFYPYLLNEYSHRQFAYALLKLKNSPEYTSLDLKEDLQSIFRQANKGKRQKVKIKQPVEDSQTSSLMSSIVNYPLIDVNSQTRSQIVESQFYLFDIEERQIGVTRRNSDSSMSPNQEEYEEFMYQHLIKQSAQFKLNKIVIAHNKDDFSVNSDSQLEEIQSQDSSDSQSQLMVIDQQSLVERSQFQQIQWFQLCFSIYSTNFIRRRLYNKFNYFVYLNTFHMIKYLSNQSNLQYIARHTCNQKMPMQSFRCLVERGDQVNYYQTSMYGGYEQRIMRWIQVMGPTHIFKWIIDIALAINQLEDLGIYHADLFFRNTISFTKGNTFRFKIIDFDKAFKITQTERYDKSFECTKDMFDFWLRFRFGSQHPRVPVYHFDIQSQQQSRSTVSSTYYDQRDILDYIFVGGEQQIIQQLLEIKRESIFSAERLPKCLMLLNGYMRVSHLKQYSALVQRLLLLDSKQELQFSSEIIQPQKIQQSLDELGRLKEGRVSYIQFVERVRKIIGFKRQQVEEQVE